MSWIPSKLERIAAAGVLAASLLGNGCNSTPKQPYNLSQEAPAQQPGKKSPEGARFVAGMFDTAGKMASKDPKRNPSGPEVVAGFALGFFGLMADLATPRGYKPEQPLPFEQYLSEFDMARYSRDVQRKDALVTLQPYVSSGRVILADEKNIARVLEGARSSPTVMYHVRDNLERYGYAILAQLLDKTPVKAIVFEGDEDKLPVKPMPPDRAMYPLWPWKGELSGIRTDSENCIVPTMDTKCLGSVWGFDADKVAPRAYAKARAIADYEVLGKPLPASK